MQPSRRPQRFAEQVQQEISMMISCDMKDRRVGFVTVTGIQMSADLRHAKIFVSLMGSEQEKEESLAALNHATGWMRHELGRRIRMRYLPDLVFWPDNSQEYGERIDRLLEEIREHRNG